VDQGSGSEQEQTGDQSGSHVVHHNAPATREVLEGADGPRLADVDDPE
jgi:hypothetical protein